MLKFIKSLFVQEEKTEERIPIKDLNGWLDRKSQDIFENLRLEIASVIKSIKNEKEDLMESIKKLEKAELQNPDIPNRAKTIMQGNREAFIKKFGYFHENIDMEYENFDEIEKKCKILQRDVDLLAKATARSYAILNEFFSREIIPAAQIVKKIESLSKEIQDLIIKSKINGIEILKNNIIDIEYKIEMKGRLLKELDEKKSMLDGEKTRLMELEGNIKKLKDGQEYKNFEDLIKQNEGLEKQLKSLDNGIFHDFSFIDKALKKYAKIAFENESLVNSYMENPINALENDDNFEIVKILGSLRKFIEQNKFEIEGKKNEKILAKLKELDKDYFIDIKSEYMKIKEISEKNKIEIGINKIKKQLENYEKEYNNLRDYINEISNNVLNLNNEIEKIDADKLKIKLGEDVKDILNEKVIVI